MYYYKRPETEEEFGSWSSYTELNINTSKGIWTLAPSRLGLKIVVAQGCNLNQVINSSRDPVWLRWKIITYKSFGWMSPIPLYS
ncbi:hypothetical protein SUGI_0861590 [Cryptomeria japonica]|nr:hypothetical protein SUGI_0861590 [Cryptomeria japonica]